MARGPRVTARCLAPAAPRQVTVCLARDRSKASGRKSMCKVCDREKARRYCEANRERKLAHMAERNEALREDREATGWRGRRYRWSAAALERAAKGVGNGGDRPKCLTFSGSGRRSPQGHIAHQRSSSGVRCDVSGTGTLRSLRGVADGSSSGSRPCGRWPLGGRLRIAAWHPPGRRQSAATACLSVL